MLTKGDTPEAAGYPPGQFSRSAESGHKDEGPTGRL